MASWAFVGGGGSLGFGFGSLWGQQIKTQPERATCATQSVAQGSGASAASARRMANR